MSANVLALFTAHATRAPDRPALLEHRGGGAVAVTTFGELAGRVERLAAGFAAHGVRRDAHVLCFVPMSVDLYAVLLATWWCGAVAVFADPWLGRARLGAIAGVLAPAAFVGVARAHLWRWLTPSLRRIPLTVTTGRRMGPFPAWHGLASLSRPHPPVACAGRAADDTAIVTYTTGSSGTPRGADRTHGLLRAQHGALAAAFPVEPADVDCTAFPVFALHNLASGIATLIPPVSFARVGATDPALLRAACTAAGVTTATFSPALMDRLAEAGAPPRLRRVLTGGAPIQDGQLRRWRAALPQVAITCLYGSTEAEPVAHIAAEDRLARHAADEAAATCQGFPVPGLRVRTLRLDVEPTPGGVEAGISWTSTPGEIGELAVSGPHVCTRYLDGRDRTAGSALVTPDGPWHRMGDTGFLDGEGRVWLVGRVHTTIRRDGVRLHPQAIEAVAWRAVPSARAVAAVGLPDPARGQRLAVVVEGAGEADATARVAAALAARGWPADEVHLARTPLPMDPRHNAKVDYDALRARLLAGGAP